MVKKKALLRCLRGEALSPPPLWFMRQAGRYLPEYRKLREEAGSFLSLCYTPHLAAEVTLQPIRRFSLDAAILFSDILIVPHALGQRLDYVESKGPVLEPVRDKSSLEALSLEGIEEKFSPIFQTVQLLKEQLPEEVACIGFAGEPWTVATYMVEGGSSRDFSKIKRLVQEKPDLFNQLMEKIVTATVQYLGGQITAGAEVIQIFDSWAGAVEEHYFTQLIIEPTRRIVARLAARYPHIPIIGFPKGAGKHYDSYAKETGVHALSIDHTLPLHYIKEVLQPIAPIQGNLDPALLAGNKEAMLTQAKRICEAFSGKPHIFNLGHGIWPETPIENVEALVKTVKSCY